MDSAILTVPSRRALAPAAPLAAAMERYIAAQYHRDTAPFAQDCAEIEAMRRAALAAAAGPEEMLAYAAQLRQIAPKFPDKVCQFEYRSSLGYTSGSASSELLLFDALNVEYNAAAAYTQQAELSQDYRVAFQQLQLAAGAFALCEELAGAPAAAPAAADLDLETLATLRLLCLAQAQECFWARQRNEAKIGNLLLAKLAAGAAQEYRRCAAQAKKSLTLKAEWTNQIDAKATLFTAAAEFRAASGCLEQSKYGEQVARLAAAAAALAQPTGRYLDPKVARQLAALRERVASDLNNATKENDLIYMQAVPTSLAPIEPKLMASAQPPPNPHKLGLFTLLLPFAVYKTPAAYQQRLANYIQTFLVSELEALSNLTAETFARLGLPASLDVGADAGTTVLPNSLLRESDAIVEAGGSEAAQSYLDKNLRLAEEARARLAALATPSTKATALLNHLETATRSDALIQESIHKYHYLVEILAGGHSAIETFLPASTATELTPELADLREKSQQAKVIVSRLEALQTKWKNQVSQYLLKVKTIDFTTPVNKYIEEHGGGIEDPAQLEPVYNSIVASFDTDLLELDHVKALHQTLLASLHERYGLFSACKAPLTSRNDLRQRQIQVLQVASHEYWKIKSNLKEGREFYNALLAKIAALETAPVGGHWTPDMPISFG